MGDASDHIGEEDLMRWNKRKNAVKEDRPPSPCGSSSSGEIKDDSDGDEAERAACVSQPQTTRNGHVEYRQNESDRVVRVSGVNDPPRRLEAETDYRRPHLTPEQISIRIRQIPTPEVLIELSDVGLRRLVADVHELDREQVRLASNRRKLLDQMRSMHEQELKALRDCMELLRRLMNERGMNLLATHIGQDVMEFLHEKDQSLSTGNMHLPASIPASSSESCPGSFGLFPATQSFAQSHFAPRPHFVPEHSASHGVLPVATSGPVILPPPPDFSVPPPFLVPPQRGRSDQPFGNPSTSVANTKDASATDSGAVSSMSAPLLSAPNAPSAESSGAKHPRDKPSVSASERTAEQVKGSSSFVPRNGGTTAEEDGGPRPQTGPEKEHSGGAPANMPQQQPPSVISLMKAQRIPQLRDGITFMDGRGVPFLDERGLLFPEERRLPFLDERGLLFPDERVAPFPDERGLLFPDERGLLFPNNRVVSMYDDGRLPFHEYEHPQGEDAIRIRHVWNTRSLIYQKSRMLGVFRDRKVQRTGRILASEMRDRSRSPLSGPKTVPNDGTGGAGDITTNGPSDAATATAAGRTTVLLDENSEPVPGAVDKS